MVIHRCIDDEAANRKIQELLHHFTIAAGYGISLPQHQEIWYCGFNLSPMIQDELTWFSGSPERFVCKNPQDCVYAYCSTLAHQPVLNTRSFGNFLSSVDSANEGEGNSVALLYNMLDDDEFEHLMAYLIPQHPDAKDVTTEDYVLSLFVEHAKKVKNG